MQHLPSLISDLALILVVAAVVSILFKKLRQPIVLGYIIAGLLVGPNFDLIPTVVEPKGIQTWAEIGVIFLLFGLGLEFSFKKLLKVGSVAVISALFGIGLTLITGFSVGKLLGWGNMDCLFLGGALSIASTTIIIRAFDELEVRSKKFANIVLGILVIEDVMAVVLMVLLSTVSISKSFEGVEMFESVLKLVFFLILWFISGIFFIPTLLRKLRRLINDETLLILSLGLCFLMVVLADMAGFSSALGAFIMGSILAETTKAERIHLTIKPLKSLFGAIFFVSVGMLINISVLVEYWYPILLCIFVLLLGKPFFITIGSLVSGQPLKTAVQTGMSLSQIGEFSFIIASLGLSLNVTSDFLYPIAVAVSVVTTFTTPMMIRLSEPVFNFLFGFIPDKWNKRLARYSAGAQVISEESDWRKVIKYYLVHVSVFSVIILTIILFSTEFLHKYFNTEDWNDTAVTLFTLATIAPFLWALAFRRIHKNALASIWLKPNQRGPLVVLLLSRVVLAIVYLGYFFYRMYSPLVAFIGIIISSAILLLFRKRLRLFYGKIELRFMDNLNQRNAIIIEKGGEVLTPGDSHMATFPMLSEYSFMGMTLSDLELRERFGINVAAIRRDDIVLNVPGRNDRIYPHDELCVIGTDEQLERFRDFLNAQLDEEAIQEAKQEVSLHHLLVTEKSSLLGLSIRDSKIRERTHGLVVGIERDGKRILNPDSNTVFELLDNIWLVGDHKRIQVLVREAQQVEP